MSRNLFQSKLASSKQISILCGLKTYLYHTFITLLKTNHVWFLQENRQCQWEIQEAILFFSFCSFWSGPWCCSGWRFSRPNNYLGWLRWIKSAIHSQTKRPWPLFEIQKRQSISNSRGTLRRSQNLCFSQNQVWKPKIQTRWKRTRVQIIHHLYLLW